MGNWSNVILCFTGIDEKACDDPCNPTRRLALIDKLLPAYGRTPWIVPEVRSSCEIVAICSMKGFYPEWTENYPEPDDLLSLGTILRSIPWEFPDQVEVFWKNEDMDQYEVFRPFGGRQTTPPTSHRRRPKSEQEQ